MPEPTNPPPALGPGYYVYMDVLGFTQQVIESYQTGTQGIHFQNYRDAFNRAFENLQEVDGGGWRTRVFSDNIILAHPTGTPRLDDLESTFGFIVNAIGAYQLSMVLGGFFIRGGWSFGDFCIDNLVLYGWAVLDAYCLESETAIYPRIVLSDLVKELVERHLRFYGDRHEAPQNIHLLRGEGEIVFVNYLAHLVDDDGFIIWDGIRRHRDITQLNLNAHVNDPDPRVYEKYVWVAQYHNYFCSFLTDEEGYDPNVLINNVPGVAQISRLVP